MSAPAWELIRSARRSLVIHVHRDGRVLVRAPLRMPRAVIEQFVGQKQDWIAAQLQQLAEAPKQPTPEPLDVPARPQAIARISQRVTQVLAGLSQEWQPAAIRYRCMRSRWGSCNSRREITLNTQLAALPDELIDYVICHELAHLREMNHSAAFYAVQTQLNPHWPAQREAIKPWALRLQ